MSWPQTCAVVIPCLNEAAAIATVVREVSALLPTVIVVDDGSSDDTAKRAAEAGAEVLRHPQTLGKGAALRTGWQRARERGFEWVMTMDGDGQHAAEDIPAFLARADLGKADLVIGNRMSSAGPMPKVRRFVNGWMSARISTLVGVALPDTQCGFRLMRLAAWQKLPLQTSHFEIESELLAAMLLHGFRVDFVPIQVIYKNEQSKIHPLRDVLRWFRWYRQTRAKFQQKKCVKAVV